jgi:hypothetical protein
MKDNNFRERWHSPKFVFTTTNNGFEYHEKLAIDHFLNSHIRHISEKGQQTKLDFIKQKKNGKVRKNDSVFFLRITIRLEYT